MSDETKQITVTESPPRMKVAFQSVVWGQRIDNLDYMLQVLQACGYQGLEIAQSPQNIFVMGKNGPEPVGTINDLIARCQKYGLTLIGLVGGTLEERVEYIGIRRDLFLYLDNWPEDAWQLLVQPNPIRLAIHPHWLMSIRKRSHFEALVESVYARIVAYYDKKGHSTQQSKTKAETACQNLRLIVDTAHSVIAEDDPVAFVSDWLPSLEVVHLKGWKPDFGRWSHRYPKGFCIPDKGIVPVDAVMDRLTELKYSGWLVIEQDHFEQSRVDTVLKCAEWVEKNASQWPVQIKVDYDKVAALTANPPPNPWRGIEGTLSSIEMARAFAANPTTSAESFYRNTVTTLRNLLKPEFAKFWSYNPSTQRFYLLDALDRNGQTIKCRTELPEEGTLAGTVAATPTVLIHDLDDPDTRRQFNDAEFLSRVESRWMICVPIFNAANAHHLRGMFSLFTDVEYTDQQKRLLELLSHIVAIWADFVGGEVCAAAAGATNYLCGVTKGGVEPFIDRLRMHLLEMFDCANVSIFLRDASRTRLYATGTCASKIRWKEGLPLAKQFYLKGEGLTGRVWNEKEMLFSDEAPKTRGYVGKSREFNSGGREQILFAPLARINGEVLGVIRLCNKNPRPNSSGSTMFTDDDAARLDAIIQAALPHLELLLTQRHQASSLVRLNHELQNPLVGINGAVDAFKVRLKSRGITNVKAEYGADYLGDILSYRALMSRLALNAKLFGETFERLRPEFARCDLAVSVVEPVTRQLSPLLKSYNLPDNKIRTAQFKDVIPWLNVDKLMMQQVFFNIITNAIKYRDRPDNFRVEIKASVSRGVDDSIEWYVIDVEDWGMGLDDDPDAPTLMFLPGVRGIEAAKKKDPAGTGIGLSVVREIIELHGGTVNFVSNRGPVPFGAYGGPVRSHHELPPPYKHPTRIRIRLPAYLRHSKPKLF